MEYKGKLYAKISNKYIECTKTVEDLENRAKELEYLIKNINKVNAPKSIFLIEKGWIDPLENHTADGYEPFSFRLNEQEAKDFCEAQGYWTRSDCWSIVSYPDHQMMKYRYKEIKYL